MPEVMGDGCHATILNNSNKEEIKKTQERKIKCIKKSAYVTKKGIYFKNILSTAENLMRYTMLTKETAD